MDKTQLLRFAEMFKCECVCVCVFKFNGAALGNGKL